MNILHLMPYSPVPPTFGGALRNYHILKMLTTKHQVTVLTFGGQAALEAIRKEFSSGLRDVVVVQKQWSRARRRLGQLYSIFTRHSFFSLVIGQSDAMQGTLDALLAENSFDIVQTEFTPMGLFHMHTDAITVLDAHNVEADNYRQMWLLAHSWPRRIHYRNEYKKLLGEEADACRRYDAVFVTSEQDRKLLDRLAPATPKFLVPNGVDTSYFHPAQQPPEPYSLVFTGMMAYVPNYDAALYFLDEIFPLVRAEIPDAKIYFVGDRPPRGLQRRASDHVVVTGYVDDVRPFVWRSSVYVVPIRMGSGTRLKVLEAMAMHKPIVTTSIGCAGLDTLHAESVMIADEPTIFSARVVELLRNAELRQKLVHNGYTLVRSRYEWHVVGDQLEQAYHVLKSSKNGQGARLHPVTLTNTNVTVDMTGIAKPT